MDNVRLSISSTGTLVVQSSAAGQTYRPDPLPTLADSRFETTDLALIKDNAVYLHGRATDIINVAGRKIAPETIEHALRSHPDVTECIVFGVPASGQRSESIVACVNSSAKIADLSKFLSTKLPGWQIPRQWWFTPDLQPNLRGKLPRHEWREKFRARSL
jgi:acyl-coenzyme A synthetase/AMP-(fatty) acid ligase